VIETGLWDTADTHESRKKARWWLERKPDDAAHGAHHIGSTLLSRQGGDLERDSADFNTLYEGNNRQASTSLGGVGAGQDLPAFNVIQSVTDTIVSQLTRQKVRPMFLTRKGDYALKEKAKNLTAACEATFEREGIYGEKGRVWCLDGCVRGGGHLKTVVDYEKKRVRYERVWNHQLFVGEKDSQFGEPQTLYFVGSVSRTGLEAQHKNDKKKLRMVQEAPSVTGGEDPNELTETSLVEDRVLVVEAWHLPSTIVDRKDKDCWDWNKAKHDGRRIIALAQGDPTGDALTGAALLTEAWPFEYFPITNFAPKSKSVGWRKTGVAEALLGIQVAVNRMSKRLDGILHMHARPLIIVDRGAKVNTHALTNDWATILEVSLRGGVQYITPASVPGDFIEHLERLIRWGYEQYGISPMAAQAKKPEGIRSGVAIRTVLDNDSVRQSVTYHNWEDAHMHLTTCTVDGFRMLAEHVDGFEVASFGEDKDLRRMKWGEFDLESEKCQLKPWPTNLLPQTPSAKFEKVFELHESLPGGLSREQFVQLLGMPDVEGAMADESAMADNIDRAIGKAKNGASDLVLDEHMDLELYETRIKEAINRVEADGEGDSAAARALRKGLRDVKNLIRQMTPAAPPPPIEGEPPPGAEGPPPGGPMGPEGVPAPQPMTNPEAMAAE